MMFKHVLKYLGKRFILYLSCIVRYVYIASAHTQRKCTEAEEISRMKATHARYVYTICKSIIVTCTVHNYEQCPEREECENFAPATHIMREMLNGNIQYIGEH